MCLLLECWNVIDLCVELSTEALALYFPELHWEVGITILRKGRITLLPRIHSATIPNGNIMRGAARQRVDLARAPSFASSVATLDSVDLMAVERLANRGDVCEECCSRPAVSACLDCDEVFCTTCFDLCHLVEPQNRHDRLPYPVPDAAVQAYIDGARGVDLGRLQSPSASVGQGRGAWGAGARADPDADTRTALLSPLASTAVSSPHSAGGAHIRSPVADAVPSPTASETNFVQGSRVFTELVYGESVGIQLEEVRGRGLVVKGFDESWNREANPQVEIGDVVIGAGHHDLRGLSLGDAMGTLHACGVPRAIRFRKDPPEFIARSKVEPDKSVSITSTLYTVTFMSPRLGMLVEWTRAGLVVRGFEAECDPAIRGTVTLGDYIVSVNAVILDGLSKARALDVLLSASVPRVVQFRRLVRHIQFAPWALSGPAELGAPPDFSGHLSPDAGAHLVVDSHPYALLPQGIMTMEGAGGGPGAGVGGEGPGQLEAHSLATASLVSTASLHSLSPHVSVTSHTSLVGGGSSDVQYMGLGPRGAVGKMKARFKAEEIKRSLERAGITVEEDSALGLAQAEPPLTPSSSFRVHSTRFPYLVPVPTVEDKGASQGVGPAGNVGPASPSGPPSSAPAFSTGGGRTNASTGASDTLGSHVIATATGAATQGALGRGADRGGSAAGGLPTGVAPGGGVGRGRGKESSGPAGGKESDGDKRPGGRGGGEGGDEGYEGNSDGSGELSDGEINGGDGLMSLSRLARLRRRFMHPPGSSSAPAADAWKSLPPNDGAPGAGFVPQLGPDGQPGMVSKASKWWMPLVETLITRRADKKSAPRFQPNDRVMFFTRERAAGPKYILGRIVSQREYMKARRGKQSSYFYQVTWTDYTVTMGVPDSALSPRSFEQLRQVRGLSLHCVRGCNLSFMVWGAAARYWRVCSRNRSVCENVCCVVL